MPMTIYAEYLFAENFIGRAVDTPADGAVVRKNSETVEDCRGGGALRAVFFYYFIKSVGNYDADL